MKYASIGYPLRIPEYDHNVPFSQRRFEGNLYERIIHGSLRAGVAQLVERHVANVNVVGSSPITRFLKSSSSFDDELCFLMACRDNRSTCD